MKTSPSRMHGKRGSLLVVALVFAAAIAMMLTTYIRMSTTALNLAQRAFCENQAMNLTESGLEMAMAAINANTWPSPWVTSGTDATATFTSFTLTQGATGSVQVWVNNYSGSSPLVVAKGIVTPGGGTTSIYKMVEVSGLVQRSLFAKGLVGRNGISFSGNNASVDSWDSNPTAASGAYTPVVYSATSKDDNGSIAAVSVTATDAVGNANIWGSASVGGNSTSAITVGPQGSVGPFGTAAGTKDSNSVSANFTDNLPTPTNPTLPGVPYSLGSVNSTTGLPRVGDVAASDGKYYYYITELTLGGNSDALNIAANSVVLLFTTASGADAITMHGNSAAINVASGGNLAIYTQGNISISGTGLVNSNATSSASAVQIWGTNASDPATHSGTVSQSITIKGNGSLAATVYAPNASLSATGGGNNGAIYGSFVAYSVNITGHDSFHYDENLGRQGNAGFFSPTKWRELVTSTDRAYYTSHF